MKFSHISPDGDEGYPGNLRVSVTYCLEKHTLSVHYSARTDKTTPVNLTNHSYFNLGGHVRHRHTHGQSDTRTHARTLADGRTDMCVHAHTHTLTMKEGSVITDTSVTPLWKCCCWKCVVILIGHEDGSILMSR